jgi:hypothetical protein
MRNDRGWLAPLTGLAFVLLAIVAFMIGGEPPDVTEDPTREVVDFYVDNKDQQMVGGALIGVAGTLFVFFGGVLRRILSDAEGERGILSAVAFAGTVIFAVGLAIDGTISFALAETADDISPAAVEALNALWMNDFLPFSMGLQIFLLATGLSIVLHGALPKWVGWIAIVLAVVAVTPIGFAAFLGGGLLIAVISVMLALRMRPRTTA